MSNLSPNDAVDVAIQEPGADTPVLRRARILDRLHSGFLVDVPGHSSRLSVSREQIRRRVVLPWKPADLHDYLVILRRRNASKDDYVEDLRTRRAFMKNLLQILTAIERWRADEHPGPMHQYYTGFDVRNDEDIELLFPEDDIPEGLHFEDVDETEKKDALTQLEFVHWLTEGRHDCEVAYTLLQAWTSFFKSSGNDALPDFFAELVHEENRPRSPRQLRIHHPSHTLQTL